MTNTGNMAIANVVVTDDNHTPGTPVDDFNPTFIGGDTDGDNQLDVGETWTFTATHTLTQAEIDSNGGGDGDIDNTATADSDQTGPDSDSASVPVAQTKVLHIEKDASVPGGTANVAGETITYTYTVTNTGNAAVANVVVTDDNLTPGVPGDDFSPTFTGGDTDNDGLLDVGETWTYTATHTVTQAEIDAANDLVNVATVMTDAVPLTAIRRASEPLRVITEHLFDRAAPRA